MCVCVDVAYLCAHKSPTIMIDMLEDEVALETQKHKMPYIHPQMEKQRRLFILCASAIVVIFVLIIFYLSFLPLHLP